MQLTPGTRLGPYEILSPLGVGGMGEVYRAKDTRLGREVAVKVLRQHLSANAEVRARFEREAKTVSSPNHPNICTLFDVGREGDTDYLVMELIEGQTLANRLGKGPLPIADALRIGHEIADALDRAHRAGVIHRDLKPGNIMLTKSGAKLMDFGLARATGMAGGANRSGSTIDALTQSSTVAQPLTAAGTIIGTFLYMSPEQLEGRRTDVRSDLWALGCVLYEMTTGKRAFEGKSQAALIRSIMGSEPVPISQVAPLSPPVLDRLVGACLAKDPADRIQSAHDVKLQLGWISDAGSQAGVPKPVAYRQKNRERLVWIVAGVAVVGAAALAFALARPHSVTPAVHAYLQPPRGAGTSGQLPGRGDSILAISADGSAIAFCAREGQGPGLLWVRSLGADDARAIPGTEGALGPFFSPDGRSLGFFAGGKLKRVDVGGGPVITLANAGDPRGATWNQDDVILFTPGAWSPVLSVSADGGAVSAVTTLDTTLGEITHRYPHFLPDGRRFLYLARRGLAGAGESPTIYVGELGSDRRTPVLEVASNVIYASGHLIYIQGGVLVAQRFNQGSLTVQGPAVPLVDDARMDERFSRGVFAASSNGVIVCMTGNHETRTQMRWLDRTGKSLGDVGEPADYTFGGRPQISPDGKSAVMSIANRDRGVSDVWVIDLDSGRRRRLTVDTLDHPAALWLPVGSTAVVSSNSTTTGSGLDAIRLDGAQSRIVTGGVDQQNMWPESATGDWLLYVAEGGNPTGFFLVELSGNGEPQAFADMKGGGQAQFSPNGRYLAYTSDETGRGEVFVIAFPQPGGRWQASPGGGIEPRWSRTGRELFYIDPQNQLVSVEVETTESGFQTGSVRPLFEIHAVGHGWRYDVAPDGNRFLVTVALEEDLASPVTLITNWTRRVADR